MNTLESMLIDVLVDEIYNYIEYIDDNPLCRCCAAHDACPHPDDPDMIGTECHAIIRTWAQDMARKRLLDNRSIDEKRICIIDGHHGRYIPQIFAETFDWAEWGLEKYNLINENRKILLAGPDHEEYWEVWDIILQDAVRLDPDTGLTWTLSLGESGDLFMEVQE